MMLPRIVFVHGTESSASEWDTYRALLPALDVSAIDLPGHGDRIDVPFTTDSAMQAIGEGVQGASPVILVGHSLGGYLATRYASLHPGAIAGLVLCGATGNPQSRLNVLYKMVAWFAEHLDPRTLFRFRERLARRVEAEGGVLVTPGATTGASLSQVWAAVLEDCSMDQIKDVSCPVLIVNGQFDQMRIHQTQYQRLSGAELVEIPRGGHQTPFTRSPEVAAAISKFAADVSAAQQAA